MPRRDSMSLALGGIAAPKLPQPADPVRHRAPPGRKLRSQTKRNAPAGTVTFLLTDLEASTRQWEVNPAAMRSARARHDAILNAAIGEHRGFVVEAGREGDSVLASFSRAGDAVGAALAIQRRFREQDWPEGGELRIRVALHTGEAEYRAGHYYGQAVYRCARLLAAANGGQVLLSQATRQVAGDELPKGVALIDHGEHRLKDLVRPERIFQLADAQAPPDRRAIRSLDRRLNNLPAQLTPLFGREDDLRRLTAAAARGRLLTLTGAGGSGKTRLAIDLASRLAGAHADGAWLVELGPLADPRAVAPAILHTLG